MFAQQSPRAYTSSTGLSSPASPLVLLRATEASAAVRSAALAGLKRSATSLLCSRVRGVTW